MKLCVALAALILSPPASEIFAAEITVFAASSLTDSLKEIATAYENRTGDKIVFNFLVRVF